MFINRNWERTEHDDYALNVEKHVKDGNESVPVYHDLNEDGNKIQPYIIGWKIQKERE